MKVKVKLTRVTKQDLMLDQALIETDESLAEVRRILHDQNNREEFLGNLDQSIGGQIYEKSKYALQCSVSHDC
jgi:hypothetical protein